MDIPTHRKMQEEDLKPVPAPHVVLNNQHIEYAFAICQRILAVFLLLAVFKYAFDYKMAHQDHPLLIDTTVCAYAIAVVTTCLQYYINTFFESVPFVLPVMLAGLFVISLVLAPITLALVVLT